MAFWGYGKPKKWLMTQKAMVTVSYALLPLVIASVYFFGWRSLAVLAVVLFAGLLSEAAFTYREGKPVTSAVFVTCLIYYLSLPPSIPFFMAVIGIIFGIVFGKMVFGGFGQNVFNPAMVGRCFLYITFPVALTNGWASPIGDLLGGFASWSAEVDAVTLATPLTLLRTGQSASWSGLFLGNTAGSLGETSAILILICGGYIIYKKAANWRLALSCLIGGLLLSGVLHFAGASSVPSPGAALLSGAFLFGTAFIVTEPISGPKTKQAMWIYGFFIGGITIILRGYSNFSEGVMFAVLLMNAFVPLMDQTVRQIQTAKKASK